MDSSRQRAAERHEPHPSTSRGLLQLAWLGRDEMFRFVRWLGSMGSRLPTQIATAFTGGFIYTPARSKNLGCTALSLERLRCFFLFGPIPRSFQIRATVALLTPTASAIVRVVHCRPSAGEVLSVASTMACLVASSNLPRAGSARGILGKTIRPFFFKSSLPDKNSWP